MNKSSIVISPNFTALGVVQHLTVADCGSSYFEYREYLRSQKRSRMLIQVLPLDKMYDHFEADNDGSEWFRTYEKIFLDRPRPLLSVTLAHEMLTVFPIFRGTPPCTLIYGCKSYVAVTDNDAQMVQLEIEMKRLGGWNRDEVNAWTKQVVEHEKLRTPSQPPPSERLGPSLVH